MAVAVSTIRACRQHLEWQYDRYFDFLENLGVTVIRVPAGRTYSTTKHQWGLAAFHFYDRVYENMSEQIRHAYAKARALQA